MNLLIFAVITISSVACSALRCQPKQFQFDSFVCLCNSTYCDTFDEFNATKPGIVTIFQSDKSKHRFDKRTLSFNNQAKLSDGLIIKIDRNKTFQSIIGFGAAFTDATGINVLKLDKKLGENLIKNYFGQHGLRYSVGRVPIGGTDFSTRPYSYDDSDTEDIKLDHFKLADEDFKYKIPLIKLAATEATFDLKLFASPWSPPAWMKTNNRINGEGTLKGETGGPYYKAWAEYIVRFLDEYKKNEIQFWGLTVQNEPYDGTIPDFAFNCLGLKPEQQRDFISKTLGPKLNSSGYGKNVLKLIAIDDQRPFLGAWVDVIMGDPEVAKYVSGMAFHWYLNALSSPDVLNDVHNKYPDYFLLSTEACEGSSPFETHKVALGDWGRAESYAYDIIQDLQRFTAGWIDWNMALDMEGGPNWVKNFVDSPIIVNGKANEYYKQPMYYALAHFTRFLSPGSIRLGAEVDDEKAVNFVVFKTPTNSTVAILLNRFESDIPVQIIDPIYGSVQTTISGHSIQTFVWFD